jgi:hypothetical protein
MAQSIDFLVASVFVELIVRLCTPREMKRESEDEQGVRRRQIPMSTSSPDETSYSIVGKGRSVSTSSLGTLRGRFCNSYSTRKRFFFFFFFFLYACSAHSPLCCAARHAHDTTADGDADNGLLSPRKLKNKRKRHHSMLKLWPHEPEPFLEETGSPFSFLYKSHVRTPPPNQSLARCQTHSRTLLTPTVPVQTITGLAIPGLFIRTHHFPCCCCCRRRR